MHGGFWKRKPCQLACRQPNGMLCPSLLPDRFLELPNTCRIDCHSARCRAFLCTSDKLPVLVGKSPFQRVATPLGFEPRITPPKGAVLPLHHGVSPRETLDWPF